jgi:hypothetical protein
MKFHPILFSTEMVKALLEGRKTMTRRILKEENLSGFEYAFSENEIYYFRENKNGTDVSQIAFTCPYGEVGDVLWVREEHYAFGIWKPDGLTKTGKQKWKFKRTGRVYYNDTYPENFNYYKSLAAHTSLSKKPDHASFYKRLGRFMPKKYCRIFLKIKSIRAERLHKISETDAKAEGVTDFINMDSDLNGFAKTKNPNYRTGFARIWFQLNGRESWKANPFVWVIEFEQISKPKNFNS